MILAEALDKNELNSQDRTKDIISQVNNHHHHHRLEEDRQETPLLISELHCSKQHHPAADPHDHRP
jgi:hypothetical protein